jgi:hypothetical protein
VPEAAAGAAKAGTSAGAGLGPAAAGTTAATVGSVTARPESGPAAATWGPTAARAWPSGWARKGWSVAASGRGPAVFRVGHPEAVTSA